LTRGDCSLDRLVGKSEQLVGNSEIERPCRFEIDHGVG